MKQCTHINRSGPLHPSVVVGGGVSLGQCECACVPGMVFCEEHASPYAMAMHIRSLTEEIATLKAKGKVRAADVGPMCIVFDGAPGPVGPRFVEVEVNGASVSAGEWVHRADGFWQLVLNA